MSIGNWNFVCAGTADGDVFHGISVLTEQGKIKFSLRKPLGFGVFGSVYGGHCIGKLCAGHIGDQNLSAVFDLIAERKLLQIISAADDQAAVIGTAGKIQ